MTPFDRSYSDCPVCDDEEAATQWDAILSDQAIGPVSDEDRQWAAQSFGNDDDLRQQMIRQWFRIGRQTALAELEPYVSPELERIPHCLDAMLRGHRHGLDEIEVNEAMVAMEKLPWDHRPAPRREGSP